MALMARGRVPRRSAREERSDWRLRAGREGIPGCARPAGRALLDLANPGALGQPPRSCGIEPSRAGNLRIGGSGAQGQPKRCRPVRVTVEGDHEAGEERVAAPDRVAAPLVEHALVPRTVRTGDDGTLGPARHDP